MKGWKIICSSVPGVGEVLGTGDVNISELITFHCVCTTYCFLLKLIKIIKKTNKHLKQTIYKITIGERGGALKEMDSILLLTGSAACPPCTTGWDGLMQLE